MDYIRGAPHQPQTRGKIPLIDCFAIDCREIERWCQTMKNWALPANYFLLSALERQIGTVVDSI